MGATALVRNKCIRCALDSYIATHPLSSKYLDQLKERFNILISQAADASRIARRASIESGFGATGAVNVTNAWHSPAWPYRQSFGSQLTSVKVFGQQTAVLSARRRFPHRSIGGSINWWRSVRALAVPNRSNRTRELSSPSLLDSGCVASAISVKGTFYPPG